MDAGKNRSGNILLELCRGNNLFIVNGRIGDDYLESGRLGGNGHQNTNGKNLQL
jgi:hypothetical protein